MGQRRIAILGGCGGIGRGVVAACLARGDAVAVLDLPVSLGLHPPPEATVAIAVDGADAASVAAAFGALEAQWGALEGFVNAAGFLIDLRSLAQTSAEDFDTTIAGNLRTTFLACKAAMTLLENGNAPSLVNISSGLGSYIRPNHGAYAAAKAGMIALTKTLALEHAPRVRVNAVAPGAVDTAFLRGGTGRSDEGDAIALDIKAYSASIPLRRIAVVEDVVGPIMFLLGPDSGYMTGQTLWLNGGAYMP